jgi:oxygen-independent coproporphyrinogen III oxidase
LKQLDYKHQFGSDVMADFPELSQLFALNLAIANEQIFTLTETGIEKSDVIGAWLFSDPRQSIDASLRIKISVNVFQDKIKMRSH